MSGLRLRSTTPSYSLICSHLVTKRHHAALVGFDFGQMQGDVSVELLEEGDPIADQNRHDRIANFVGEPKTKTLAGNGAAPDKPNRREPGPEALIDELRKRA